MYYSGKVLGWEWAAGIVWKELKEIAQISIRSSREYKKGTMPRNKHDPQDAQVRYL